MNILASYIIHAQQPLTHYYMSFLLRDSSSMSCFLKIDAYFAYSNVSFSLIVVRWKLGEYSFDCVRGNAWCQDDSLLM